MLSCVYRVKFDSSSFELNEEYDVLSDYEKERISELDAESFFDCDSEDGNYICYIITNTMEMKAYTGILNSNLIKFECDDLSQDILRSRINIEEDLRPQINTVNSVKYSFFIDDLNDWIYRNLDMDTILDRISESGMSSLTDIEKLFLTNFNTN